MSKVHIAGGGIGGLAAALACARVGHAVSLCERVLEVSEVGAGIQLGPNVVKVLYGWGLEEALTKVAVFPQQLEVRSAISDGRLSSLRLGEVFQQRYGAPYLTIHRADLHSVLLRAVQAMGTVSMSFGSAVTGFTQEDDGISTEFAGHPPVHSDLLVGADGGWSMVRKVLLNDGTPQPTGHLAYRAMVPQVDLPPHLRSDQITAWLGPKLHVVQYPVRGGEWLNVVAIVHGEVQGDVSHWDHSANAKDLQRSMAMACAPLRELVATIAFWRLWPLSIRPPMRGPQEHADGRVALLGDAAHPMLPYLAQGAGMAIEDASALAWALGEPSGQQDPVPDVPAQLQRYAQARWQRNARVQAHAIKNGQIFHATGLMRWGRDAALRLLGENLLNMPWLYGADSHP